MRRSVAKGLSTILSTLWKKGRINFNNAVEKVKRVWYNGDMTIKPPDFSAVAETIKRNEEKFDAFFELLISYNARYNLTAITEKKEVNFKHFVDSLAGAEAFPAGARVLEVGSGAGFPSIPLMLARGDLRFTLVESTGKKCEFLRAAVKKFGLFAEVINKRAEELAKESAFREQFDVCCARAVARLNTLAEYCMPFVKKGGSFIAYKGDAEEEIREAERALAVLGGGETETVRYSLPEGYGERALVITRKLRPTPPQYPRGQGKERSQPIK